MAFTNTSSVIYQTGTDANLSGLTGVTGVTTTVLGTGTSARTRYTLSGVRLEYVDLTIDPRIEELEFDATCTVNNLIPTSASSKITIGIIETVNSEEYGSNLPVITFHRADGNTYSTPSSMKVEYGEFYWNCGTIRCAQPWGFTDTDYDGTSDVTGWISKWATLEVFGTPSGQTNESNQMFFGLNADFRVEGLRVIGHIVTGILPSCLISMNSLPLVAPEFNLIGAGGVSYQSPNRDTELLTLRNLTGTGLLKGANIWKTSITRVTNTDLGSALPIVEHNDSDSQSIGYCEIRQEVDISITDETGAEVNAKYYCIDTDNGDRKDYSSPFNNLTSDYIYEGSTTNGVVSITTDGGILICAVAHNNATWSGVDDTGECKKDRRGNDNDTNDNFTFNFCSYDQQVSQQIKSLKALGAVQMPIVMITDSLITETTKATVDAYTSIDNAFQLYDRAKSYLYDNFGGESSTILSRSGSQILLGTKNLTIDGTAGSVLAYNGSTLVTIKSTTFLGGASGTGIVTLNNGATLGTSKFDCDVYLNSAEDFSNTTINGDLHVNTGADSTLTFSAVTVTGSVYNDATGNTLVINSTDGSLLTAASAGTSDGQTSIVNSVPIKVTVKDATDLALIAGARVYIKTAAGGPSAEDVVLVNTLTDAAGEVNTTVQYDGDQPVSGTVRKGTS